MKRLIPMFATAALLAQPVFAADDAAANAAPAAEKPAAPQPTLTPGSSVTLDAVKAASWIQGEAPNEWKEGDVYIFECWATWCGPCIAAIPHVNDLHKKYSEKGLHIYGMNVWDKDEPTAADFVKKKGDGMSYPIAYVAKGQGAFEKEWLQAAGVRGIPHAFVVADGKLLFSVHPMQLQETTIENLLAGGEKRQNAIDSIQKSAQEQSKVRGILQEISQAIAAKDPETAETKLSELQQLSPNHPGLSSLKLNLAVLKQDWPAVQENVAQITAPGLLLPLVASIDQLDQPAPQETNEVILAKLEELVPADNAPELFNLLTAKLHWQTGDKEGAKTLIKEMSEKSEKYSEQLTELHASLEQDSFPKLAEILTKLQRVR